MIVDEPSGYTYYGSLVAAPYAGRVFENLFAYKGMLPAASDDVKTVIMPDLTDMSLTEALRKLKELSLQCEIAGNTDKILSVMPMPGTEIPEGDVVLIRTEEIEI